MSDYEIGKLLNLAEELQQAIERKDAVATISKIELISAVWVDGFGYCDGKAHATRSLANRWGKHEKDQSG